MEISTTEKNGTVDNRSVVQRIRNDSILLGQDRLEEASVRVKTGREQDRVLETVELGDLVLEVLVQVLRAADEAHRGEAKTMGIHGLLRDLDQLRGVGEAEVIVRAEIEHLILGVGDRDRGLLRGGQDALRLVGAGLLGGVQLRADDLGQRASGCENCICAHKWGASFDMLERSSIRFKMTPVTVTDVRLLNYWGPATGLKRPCGIARLIETKNAT